MTANIIDGKALAHKILDRLRPRIAAVKRQSGRAPSLAIVFVGSDRISRLYASRKLESCQRVGMDARLCSPPGPLKEAAVARWLRRLAKDPRIDAIIIESPLPKPLDFGRLASLLPEAKDAEGLSYPNYGKLFSAKTWNEIAAARIPIPATASAIIALLGETGIQLAGAYAVVVGRSSIVGRPAAHLLSAHGATVTLCHLKTRNLHKYLRQADIVVAAAGRPSLIRGNALKRGAIVIDAGIARRKGKISGDVDFKSAARVAAWITPVPGGVGPVTAACLLANTVLCAEERIRRK